MRVELHCHSTCSDGSLEPDEVARRARERDVEVFCLTDHDTCAGWQSSCTGWGDGGAPVRGLELSCGDRGRTVHILVYDVERDARRWAVLEQRLEAVAAGRERRVHDIAERFSRLGITIDPDAVIAGAGRSVGRPHIARAVVEAGGARSIGEVFDRYLHDGGPADAPLDRISVEDGVALAVEAGGVVALAHPHAVSTFAADLVGRLAPVGLSGLEVYCAMYGSAERGRWRKLADEHGLVATGGSDYHGDAMPQVTRLGVDVPDEVGSRIRQWLRC